ncbi:MAG: sugar ABC transporter ATP-binding protein [Candidatus Humimicrobiaceae bacterium]
MRGITKSFPGVRALDNVTFSVVRGSIHGLVGENGAGKSTLMKILNGVYYTDTGEIIVNGESCRFKDTKEAQAKGIGLIFQEFNLINTLTAAENIYLNRLQVRSGRIAWKQINQDAQALIDELGFNFSVTEKIIDLSAAQKQLVEIAKALSFDAKLIVMDEPTSSLTTNEIDKLFEIVKKLKSEGITIIYISHKLEEIYRICEMVTIIRDGQIIDTKPVSEISKNRIIELMVGRSVDMEFPKRNAVLGEVVLDVQNLTRKGLVKGVSFNLRKGEVLGIAGLVGSGRTELAEALFGAEKHDDGIIMVKGKKVAIHSTYDGKSNSIGLLTEDRKETGLVLDYNIARNITITNLPKISKSGVIINKLEKQYAQQFSDELGVRTPSINQLAINLSGGNQQKVVLAKWLFSDVDILILDEPTRGIDVGAKYEIYLLINKLAEQGKSIIMISSELPEVLGMSDRVIVLNEGKKKGELSKDELSAEAVMHMIISSESISDGKN